MRDYGAEPHLIESQIPPQCISAEGVCTLTEIRLSDEDVSPGNPLGVSPKNMLTSARSVFFPFPSHSSSIHYITKKSCPPYR